MSQVVTEFEQVYVLNTSFHNDESLKSKSISITNNLMIETRILPNDFQFEDKNLQSLLKITDISCDKYEGGLKIWECSIDLAQCIMNSFNHKLIEFITSKYTNYRMNVLELGCGHSLPAITFVSVINNLLIKHSESEQKTDDNDNNDIKVILCLQDLNKDVLKHISIPNIWLNCKEWINSKCYKSLNAISGDWRDKKLIENLLKITQNENNENDKYDVIFGSETIYNQSMIEILINLLINLLSKPNGICFISAKSYYFGIGGGTQTLKLFMKNNNNKYPFNVDTIQRIDDGMSNLREIIVLTWKENKYQCQLSSIWSNINDFESEEEEDEEEEEEEYQNNNDEDIDL